MAKEEEKEEPKSSMMSDLRKKLREKVINTWKKMKEDETNSGMERVKNLRDKRKFA